MAEQEAVDRLMKQANIVRQNSKTSCVKLQNYLYYQRIKITNKSSAFICGGCSSDKANVKQSFCRAFKALTISQQAEFYLKNCTYVNDFLNGVKYEEETLDSSQKSSSYPIQSKQNGIFSKWVQYTIKINRKDKIIKINELREEIDLHYFLIRKSKSKTRKHFVLEGTQFQMTLRITSPHEEDYQQLFEVIEKVVDQAQRQKIIKLLLEEKKFPQKTKGTDNNNYRSLVKSQINIPIQPITLQLLNQEKGKVLKNVNFMQKIIYTSEDLDKIGEKIISKDIRIGLQTFQAFLETKPNIFYQRKGQRVRKIIKLPLKTSISWLLQRFYGSSKINYWKSYIQSVQILQRLESQRTNIIHEVNNYNSLSIDYVYIRHLALLDGINYVIDKSAYSGFGPAAKAGRRGVLNYVIWRIKFIDKDCVEILVEADVNHTTGGDQKPLTSMFIGQLQSIINQQLQQNLTMQQDTPLSLDFGKQHLSLIDPNEDINSFYSIQDHQSNQYIEKSSLNQQQIILEELPINHNPKDMSNLITPAPSSRLMIECKHRLLPQKVPKRILAKRLESHPIIGADWVIRSDGYLQNINKKQIEIQASVLQLVLKNLAKNIFSGKGIMNTSLPIQLFSKQSFLEKMCQTLTFAPILFEKVLRSNDPLQRFKSVVCFSLSIIVTSIEMVKPFNPILGETYQGFIDGCPIYAEQISHHPPISSLFMKGRGYFIYGTKQSKISMGLNSATGIYEGFYNVAFDDVMMNKNVVKFSGTYGQISGLVIGDRKFRLIKSIQVIDEQNKLYCEIVFGKAELQDEPRCKYEDFFHGQVVKLEPTFTFKEKPKKKNILKQMGMFKGRWTNSIQYQDEIILDFKQQLPCILQQYDHCLESHSNKRKDIQLKRQQKIKQAQLAKQQLQDIQRYDARLRKNRHKH